MPNKQQVYRKYARYLGRMNKRDRDFAKFVLSVGYLTKNQSESETFKKLEKKNAEGN